MRPGVLDQRIIIRRYTETDDGLGGQERTPSTYAEIWAQVVSGSGVEVEQAQQLQASNMVTFMIRNRSDILKTDVVVYGGEEYQIRAIPPVSKREMYRKIEAEINVAI